MALVVNQEDPYANGDFDAVWGSFLATDFARKEATTSDKLRLWVLTNPIHPLFHRKKFPSAISYEVIEQSLRLASRFITCGVLDGFFTLLSRHALAWMHVTETNDLGMNLHGTAYSTKQYEKYRDRIDPDIYEGLSDSLAGVTEFLLGSGDGWGAHTEREPKTVIGPDGSLLHGHVNQVVIHENTYLDLKNARSDPQKDTIRLMLLQFEFAVMLVHEIGHCLRNALSGAVGFEPFIGWSTVAEVGYEIEKLLFGGHVTRIYDDTDIRWYSHNGRKSDFEGMTVIYEYPYQGILKDYQISTLPGKFCPMQNRGEPRDRRPLDLAWRVEVTWYQRLFQDSFWLVDFPQQGHTSLWPKRTTGYCFRIEIEYDGTCASRYPVKKASAKEEEKKYLPKGYIREAASGVIRPSRKPGAPEVLHPPEWAIDVDKGESPGHLWVMMGKIYHRKPNQQQFSDLMRVRRRVPQMTERGDEIWVVYKDPQTGRDYQAHRGLPYEW